jgi:hypothetical protein
MATPDDIAEETYRLRKVRQIVDIATSLLMQSNMCREEGEQLVALVRERVLALFPGREETFEVIYAQRFSRLIDEFTRPEAALRGRLLPFRTRRT